MNFIIALFIVILYLVIGTLLGYWFYLDGWWEEDGVTYSALLWPLLYTLIFAVGVGVWIVEKIRGDY